MTQPVVSRCPFCNSETEVTEISCVRCDVQIRGHFTLSRFEGLTPEQTQFLETFLRSRGVIRDVEAALGISYPTVRARLDSLLTALGLNDAAVIAPPVTAQATMAQDRTARRKEILAAISAGTLDAETGLDALSKL